MVCKKKNVFKQSYRCFVSGFEQSVREVQWKIYKARIEGKLSCVHILQERLCESFCAKFLATEHAITSLQLNGIEGYKSCFTTTCTLPEDWKISIAQSLWRSKGDTKADFDNRHPVKNRIKKEAEQIHALLVLEPEWQAVFSQTRSKGFERGFNHEVVRESLRPDQTIKRVQAHLQGPFPQFSYSVSVHECLHVVTHQFLIEKLNTFKAMENQIKIWLKTGALKQDSQASEKAARDLKRNSPNSISHTANSWCSSLHAQPYTKDYTFVGSILQNSVPWIPTEYSLYSCFPTILWKEQATVHNLTQIEDQGCQQNHVIAGLLSRIVLDILVKRIESFSQDFFSPNRNKNGFNFYKREKTSYNARLSDSKPSWLLSASLSKTRKVQDIERQVETHNSGLRAFSFPLKTPFSKFGSRKSEDACSFLSSRSGEKSRQQTLFCSGYVNDFVMIHPDKQFLELCVLEILYPQKKTLCSHSLKSYARSSLKSVVNDAPESKYSSKKPLAKAKSSFLYCKPCSQKERVQATFSEKSNPEQFLFSHIKDCRQGFTLLGFQIIQVTRDNLYTCKVSPSPKSVKLLMLLIKDRIKQSQNASIAVWTAKLDLLLSKWIEYYKNCEHKRSYRKISYLIWEKTRSWLSRRKRKRKTRTSAKSFIKSV